MAEEAKKKRQAKAGYKRVTVSLPDADYNELVKLASEQDRELNNMLSFLLKDEISAMIGRFRD